MAIGVSPARILWQLPIAENEKAYELRIIDSPYWPGEVRMELSASAKRALSIVPEDKLVLLRDRQ